MIRKIGDQKNSLEKKLYEEISFRYGKFEMMKMSTRQRKFIRIKT